MYAVHLIYVSIFLLIEVVASERLNETVFRRHVGKYLENHIFRTEKAESEFECVLHCFKETGCASVNYKTSGIDKGLCELNNMTMNDSLDEAVYNLEYTHLEIFWAAPAPVFSSATKYFPSCKVLHLHRPLLPNGVYSLRLNSSTAPYKVYCHMTDIQGCGGGGWTLALKVDGKKSTFYYESSHWTNKESYAVEDGLEGLTEKESKLASYWNTPFKKICLGMTVNGDRRWMMLDYEASSLHSLIAGNQFQRTSAGKNAWMSMIVGSLLQANCNREGFMIRNAFHIYSFDARLGFLANNEGDCLSSDSWVGFGAKYTGCETVNLACGNRVVCGSSQLVNIPAFGYMLVQ
ncbi:uncharacterized protein LOC114520053 [Dendronephthya gigantea]|uniref:uncharacterized protein LOC114520053 n=1 Tax=Dendronephthya gigantea TaxID=151771 RepID=UPI00106C1245|nr:uncharacterized protein LOC114520053 [Dendronephthya gigantea]